MNNADSIKGIQRGTSPSKSVDRAASISWAADHQGKTDPKAALATKYNKDTVDPASIKK